MRIRFFQYLGGSMLTLAAADESAGGFAPGGKVTILIALCTEYFHGNHN
jgi:hypothetical protein